MAAKVISDINEKVLLCSICHERFQTPKTLGCQHSFCLECIKSWVKTNRGVLSCPMCRREFVIPDKGLIVLPSSYFINQLLEYTKEAEGCTQVNSCTMCNTNATAHCMECSAFLCRQCAGNHCKILPCRGHTVMPLKQYQSMDAKERAAAKPVMCPKHTDVAVEFYCVGCSLPVCMKCTVVGHKGHNLQELETAFEMFREDANAILTHCSTKETEMKAELGQHVQDTEAQKQSVTKCTQEVHRHAERLHQMVDDAKEKLLADLTKRSESDLQNRKEAKQVKEEKIAQLQNVSMFIDSLIKAPQPITALFDANETLNEARQMTGQLIPQRHHVKGMYPQHYYAVGNTAATRGAVGSNSAMSFYFQENQQITCMLSQSIGGVKCEPLKESKSRHPVGRSVLFGKSKQK